MSTATLETIGYLLGALILLVMLLRPVWFGLARRRRVVRPPEEMPPQHFNCRCTVIKREETPDDE